MTNPRHKTYNLFSIVRFKIMSDKIQHLLRQADLLKDAKESSVAFAKRAFSSVSEAENLFGKVKEKLFYIENWKVHSGISTFELFDRSGNIAHEKALAVGDFIRITLHGSGKDDWVKIIDVYQAADEVVVTVKPSNNPTAEDASDKSVTSHFFTDESTNNFCLQRNAKTVSFYVIGLREKSNTKDTRNAIESVRNFATANLGYFLGIQKAEWTTFCKNFLEVEEAESAKE